MLIREYLTIITPLGLYHTKAQQRLLTESLDEVNQYLYVVVGK